MTPSVPDRDPGAVLARAYAEGAVLGRSGKRFEIHPTGMRAEQGREIADIVAREGCQRTIETGFAFGLSGLFLCEGMLRSGRADFEHSAIDPYQATAWDDAGLQVFAAAGLSDRLVFHAEPSEYVLPRLAAADERFDLGFVDGGHLFQHAFLDLFYMTRLVRPGGIVLVDDMWMPAVRAAVDYFVRNAGLVHENRVDRRTSLRRRVRARLRGTQDLSTRQRAMAILRLPLETLRVPWDHFVPFGWRW